MDLMLLILTLFAGVGPEAIAGDTTVVLGSRSMDLTGDGQLELLEVVGRGESLDSLGVTFTITSSGRVVYRQELRPMTRTVGFDAGKRTLSAAEHRQRLQEFDDFFFAEEKFLSPEAFIAMLRGSAPRHIDAIPAVISRDGGAGLDSEEAAAIWQDMQRRGAVVFEYSAGGDAVTAIAWSETGQRFYRLWECC